MSSDIENIAKEKREAYEKARMYRIENRRTYELPDNMPVVMNSDEDEWTAIKENIYRCGGLSKSVLEDGIMYWGRSKKTWWAVWDKDNDEFYYDGEDGRVAIPHFEDAHGDFSFSDMFIPLKQDIKIGDVDSLLEISFNKKVKKLIDDMDINISASSSDSSVTIHVALTYQGDVFASDSCTFDLPEPPSGTTT